MRPPAWEQDRLYGRSQGKSLKPRQDRLIRDLLPQIAVTPENVGHTAATHTGPVWLEVGFGGGEHLASHAAQHPDTLMIGAEPFINGVAKLLTQVEEKSLTNVGVCHGDAKPVMAALPDGRLSKLFVLHPDPWPKTRHHKRRMISAPFLAHAARLLHKGGELRVSSDISDYIRWTLMHIQMHNRQSPDFDWTATAAKDWKDRPADWPGTRYEAKGVREGRPDTYLTFTRV